MRKAWEELVENAKKRINLSDSPHYEALGVEWASSRLDRLERVREAAIAYIDDTGCECYDEYNVKRPHQCGRCATLQVLREVEEDG